MHVQTTRFFCGVLVFAQVKTNSWSRFGIGCRTLGFYPRARCLLRNATLIRIKIHGNELSMPGSGTEFTET